MDDKYEETRIGEKEYERVLDVEEPCWIKGKTNGFRDKKRGLEKRVILMIKRMQ